MPWLADLVESNDSSLDVLPVQCLCEFLLHDPPSDTSADDASQAERHQKQVSSHNCWGFRASLKLLVFLSLNSESWESSKMVGY